MVTCDAQGWLLQDDCPAESYVLAGLSNEAEESFRACGSGGHHGCRRRLVPPGHLRGRLLCRHRQPQDSPRASDACAAWAALWQCLGIRGHPSVSFLNLRTMTPVGTAGQINGSEADRTKASCRWSRLDRLRVRHPACAPGGPTYEGKVRLRLPVGAWEALGCPHATTTATT